MSALIWNIVRPVTRTCSSIQSIWNFGSIGACLGDRYRSANFEYNTRVVLRRKLFHFSWTAFVEFFISHVLFTLVSFLWQIALLSFVKCVVLKAAILRTCALLFHIQTDREKRKTRVVFRIIAELTRSEIIQCVFTHEKRYAIAYRAFPCYCLLHAINGIWYSCATTVLGLSRYLSKV